MFKVLPLLALFFVVGGDARAAATGSVDDQATPPPLGEMHVIITVKACAKSGADTPLEPIYPDQQQTAAPAAPPRCTDVVIPPEVMQLDMNAAGCKSLPGYIASMQFLQQSKEWQDYVVGGWTCSISTTPVASAAQG